MIKINDKTIASIYGGEKVIEKIYKGTLKVYEAWRNLLASGVPPLTLTKCKGVDLVDYKIFGNSVQETYSGKNLFDIDKFLSLNGNSNYYKKDENNHLIQITSDYRDKTELSTLLTLPAGDYIVSGLNTTSFYFYNMDDNVTYGSKIILTKETNISFKSWAGSNFDLGLIQIEKGTNATEYEAYVGGVSSPNPDYPQEVESVGERTKNILDISKITPKGHIYYGITNIIPPNTQAIMSFKDKDTTVDISGCYIGFIEPSNALNYNPNDYCNWCIKNGEINITTSNLSTIGEKVLCTSVFLYPGNQETINKLTTRYDIQIEIGEVATEYEPYGYKIPVKVSGKNLLLATDFYQNQNNYSQLLEDDKNCIRCTDSNAIKYDGLTFEKNTQYTVSFWCKTVTRSGSGDASSRFFVFYYTDGGKSMVIQRATNGEWVYNTFTSDAGRTVSHIGMDSVSYHNWLYVDIDTFQLEEGTEATEYEPYQEPVTSNIYLNEPLRKIGDYTDYIDFEKGKVVRENKELICNGSENWFISTSKLSNCYNLSKPDMVSNLVYTGLLLYSTHFKGSEEWHTATDRSGLILAYVQHIGIGYLNKEDKIGATVDEFKAWLKEEYDNNTPLKIYYPLATPIEETIELPSIPTIKGTTILSIDTTIQPSNLEVVYKGK